MNIYRTINKPEYWFRPKQVLKRLGRDQRTSVDLLWGHKNFSCNPRETIGKSLMHFGLYDLALTEAIHLLVNSDETCLDIGANIGYFSSLLTNKANKVFSFEPHPELFKSLKNNTDFLPNINLRNIALSNHVGTSQLFIPQSFDKNEGTASLNAFDGDAGDSIEVETSTLDSLFPTEHIGSIKIDVEGHEFSVFSGASKLLKEKRVDRVFFEDFDGGESKFIQLLEAHQYSVFRLKKSFMKLQLISVEEGESIPLWEPPNYLATKCEMDFEKIEAQKFWSILRK